MYDASFLFALRFSMPTDLMLRLKLIEKLTRTANKHRIECEYKVCVFQSHMYLPVECESMRRS